MIYKVKVQESLRCVLEIEAECEEEAVQKMKDMYYGEEIILDETDFDYVDFEVVEKIKQED